MAVLFSGGCACGAIRYDCSSEPVVAGHCHCRACQRDSGTGHGSHMMVPNEALKLTGRPRYHDSKADSGNTVSRGFCPICGSPVVSRNSGYPDALFLRAASLDDPRWFKPAMVVFTSGAPAWDYIDPGLPGFPENADVPDIGGQ